MKLSALQKYIIRESYLTGKRRVSRQVLSRFYKTVKPTTAMVEAITASLERLTDKGLIISYGRQTSEKWFIDDISLTPRGRRMARGLLGQQQKLPLK